jgi:hypothetical protein
MKRYAVALEDPEHAGMCNPARESTAERQAEASGSL